MINGHDLVITADTAKFGMPEVIRGSYGATATPSLFHGGIPIKKAFYISLTGRNLTGVEAELGEQGGVDVGDQGVPHDGASSCNRSSFSIGNASADVGLMVSAASFGAVITRSTPGRSTRELARRRRRSLPWRLLRAWWPG